MSTSSLKLITTLIAITLLSANCGIKKAGSNNVEASADDSASSAAAEAIGGALSGSLSAGTQASYKFQMPESFYAKVRSEMNPFPNAMAQLLCPTFHSTDSACSANGSRMWLSYNDCSFLGRASWNGVQAITMSSGTASCGTFPFPGPNGTLYRQFVQGDGSQVPDQLVLTSGGYQGVVDDHSANLSNFDNQTIAPINPNGGYGVAVGFAANGTRSSVDIARHVYVSGLFDHSVVGDLAVSEAPASASRTVSGTVTVYHNYAKVIGTSTLNNLIHSDVCCLPVGGSITTAFSAGANVTPTFLGQFLVGKSETLTFTGCGSGVLQDANGHTKNVTLKRCY